MDDRYLAPEPATAAAPISLRIPPGADTAGVLSRAACEAEAALILLFSAHRCGHRNPPALSGLPDGCDLVSCCSSGIFHHDGYLTDGHVAIIFPRRHFRTRIVLLPDLSRHCVTEWIEVLRSARAGAGPGGGGGGGVFGLLMTVASAGIEEVVMATLDAALPGLNIVGGSLGDLGGDNPPCMMLNGQPLHDTAILCLAETDLDVRTVAFSHFTPTRQRMVVTAMSSDDRTILRLNDEPAAEEYARLIGVTPAELDPVLFARHPLLLRQADRYHVRAIAAARADGGLELMSAVGPGSLLTLGEASDHLDADFAEAMTGLPQRPQIVLGFDCILRRYAVERSSHVDALAALFDRYGVAGLNTLGEQHGGMHVNQTFVGLAFMPADAS